VSNIMIAVSPLADLPETVCDDHIPSSKLCWVIASMHACQSCTIANLSKMNCSFRSPSYFGTMQGAKLQLAPYAYSMNWIHLLETC